MLSGTTVSNAKLRFGYWYLTHKETLNKTLRYILMFLNIMLWLWLIFLVVEFFMIERAQLLFSIKQLGNSRVNYSTFNKANQPLALRPALLQSLKTTGGKNDLLVTFNNPNTNWVGRVIGKFMVGEEEYETKAFSILPGETLPVIEPGVDVDKVKGDPKFVINSIQWQRVGNRELFDRFVKEHSSFDINNIVYKTPSELKLGTKVAVAGVDFSITNGSLYDYWKLDNNVLFKQGDNVIAANVISLDEFRMGQNRQVSFRVFENLPGVSKVEVKPFMDIFETGNFIEEPLVVGELK